MHKKPVLAYLAISACSPLAVPPPEAKSGTAPDFSPENPHIPARTVPAVLPPEIRPRFFYPAEASTLFHTRQPPGQTKTDLRKRSPHYDTRSRRSPALRRPAVSSAAHIPAARGNIFRIRGNNPPVPSSGRFRCFPHSSAGFSAPAAPAPADSSRCRKTGMPQTPSRNPLLSGCHLTAPQALANRTAAQPTRSALSSTAPAPSSMRFPE